MGVIIRNSQYNGTIGRKVDTIIRTPIIVSILPDQSKICQIGDPRTADGMGYLRGGFHGNSTWYNSVESVGYQMINHLINGSPSWMDASGAHEPEMIWYQGAYASSASTISQGKFMSEAYASFPGFHFTLPNVTSPLEIKEVVVYYLNMGATLAYGPAIDGNANNTSIRNAVVEYDTTWQQGYWNNAWAHFHVLNTPTCNYHPMDIIYNSPYDTVDLATVGGRGDFRGYRDVFLLAPMGTTDGCIPTLTYPVRESYVMNATSMQHFISNGAGWIIPTFHPFQDNIYPMSDYLPKIMQNQTGQDNYWGCFSLRDVYIDVVIDVEE